MPPRKPHPRSLDALFPRPPRVPIKRCAYGHTQTPGWRAVTGCSTCNERVRRETERSNLTGDAGRAEREAWYRDNPVPDVLTMVETSTGRVIRHTIPPRLRKRGPTGRARIKRRA